MHSVNTQEIWFLFSMDNSAKSSSQSNAYQQEVVLFEWTDQGSYIEHVQLES